MQVAALLLGLSAPISGATYDYSQPGDKNFINNTAILEFTSYTLGTPKYDERECLEQGMTFAVPLKLRVRLVVFDKGCPVCDCERKP